MSEASVEWSNESFNVPGLQRNDDGKGEVVRSVKRRRTGGLSDTGGLCHGGEMGF